MKRNKTHWNFRIVTKILPEVICQMANYRVFSIVEVYYTNGKPDSYIESKRILDELESVKSLKWTNKKIKKAFKKPVLDLDNWPHKYKK